MTNGIEPRFSFSSTMSSRARPTSEIFFLNPPRLQQEPSESDQVDRVTEQWLADLELYQSTLEEMASANVDKEFKDELDAIQQWFEVLSVGERTAAIYALLQQTTQVQVRFFITVLQKMAKNDALSGVLSPTTAERDPAFDFNPVPNNSAFRQSQMMPPPPPQTLSHQHQSSLTSANQTIFPINSSPKFHGFATSAPFDPSKSPSAAGSMSKHFGAYSSQQQQDSLYNNRSATPLSRFASPTPDFPHYAPLPQPTTPHHQHTSSNVSNFSDMSGLPLTSHIQHLKQQPMKDFTPWAHMDEIHRPKSADVTLSSSMLSSSASLTSTSGNPNSNLKFKNTSLSTNRNHFNNSTSPPQPSALSRQSQMPLYGTDPSMAAVGNGISFKNPETYNSWSGYPPLPTSSSPAPFPNSVKVNSEIANNTALKLAALSTVNNRAIIDNDTKNYRKKSQFSDDLTNATNFVRPVPLYPQSSNNASEEQKDSSNSNNNNNFTFPDKGNGNINNNNNYNTHNHSNSNDNKLRSKQQQQQQQQPQQQQQHQQPTNNRSSLDSNNENPSKPNSASSAGNTATTSAGSTKNSKNNDAYLSLELLQDVAAWLKVLRLHKYTPNLKDLNWKDLVQLSDEELEKRGVSALGARRKMLKVFESVREADKTGTLLP